VLSVRKVHTGVHVCTKHASLYTSRRRRKARLMQHSTSGPAAQPMPSSQHYAGSAFLIQIKMIVCHVSGHSLPLTAPFRFWQVNVRCDQPPRLATILSGERDAKR
jgi:hypothetical protein